MTKLKTQDRITLLYYKRAGYACMYVVSAPLSQAVDMLFHKTGCKATNGISRKSRSTGFDFVLPLN